MKNISILLFFLLTGSVLSAQSDRQAENDSLRKQPFRKRLTYSMGGGFFGGSVNGNTYTNLSLQPQVGYKIRTNLIAGVGLNYQYLKAGTSSYHAYGGNSFVRYLITDQFFTQLEYQLLNYSYKGPSAWNDYLMIGGGYTPNRGVYISAFYLLKYPANNNFYGAPYVIRFGFMF